MDGDWLWGAVQAWQCLDDDDYDDDWPLQFGLSLSCGHICASKGGGGWGIVGESTNVQQKLKMGIVDMA